MAIRAVRAVGVGGDALGDTFISIENVIGSNSADALTGDGGNNALYGGLGNDSLSGGTEDDFLYGGDGADTLNGAAGTNSARMMMITLREQSVRESTPRLLSTAAGVLKAMTPARVAAAVGPAMPTATQVAFENSGVLRSWKSMGLTSPGPPAVLIIMAVSSLSIAVPTASHGEVER